VKGRLPPALHLKRPNRAGDAARSVSKGTDFRSSYEQAVRDLGVADANLKAAVRTEELLAAPPLQEDQAKADAEVLAAEGRTRTVQERIEKCSILAPIDGTVLRVYARRGESF